MQDICCNKCNKEFSVEAKNIKTKIVGNIEVQYFKCKYCNEKYITSCIDDYIEKEQTRYKKLNEYNKRSKCLKNMKMYSERLKDKVKDKL